MEGGNGTTSQKQHLLMVWKQTKKMPPGLEKVVNKPEEFSYLWDWLCELVYPLSFTELEAWQRLTGRSLSLWEVRAIIELDKVRSYG